MVQSIFRGSSQYPKLLSTIFDPPSLLYAKGCWPDWSERIWVGIVGARKATPFGRKKTREIVEELVAHDIGIVSGLAYGIDGEAHQVAVGSGGVTWGVLGSGVDQIYPLRNATLAEKMLEKGGYLSEFSLGTPPRKGNFPQRNRIISGLSHAIIIVEAGLKSGSLITARFALEQGREVFVVEPPADHVAYEGTRKLMEEGAPVFTSAENLIEEVRSLSFVSRYRRRIETKKRNENKSELLSLFKRPRSLDDLVLRSYRPMTTLLTELTHLEMEGEIKRSPGGMWKKV